MDSDSVNVLGVHARVYIHVYMISYRVYKITHYRRIPTTYPNPDSEYTFVWFIAEQATITYGLAILTPG